MTEILFYHLQRQPIERVLPMLLEKSLERGWRVIVQAASDERVDALDSHLWSYREGSFLAHGTYRENEAAMQPVLLTVHDHNPNSATVRFLIDGVGVPEDAEPAQPRNRARQAPVGNTHAHAALNQNRMNSHTSIVTVIASSDCQSFVMANCDGGHRNAVRSCWSWSIVVAERLRLGKQSNTPLPYRRFPEF